MSRIGARTRRIDFIGQYVKSLLNWSQSKSFWYVTAGPSCCADELLQTFGARYDLERFGCIPALDPQQADLLIVYGITTKKAQKELLSIYNSMSEPKYVMAIGTCACNGGAFNSVKSYSTVGGAEQTIPVDVFVPGCPPRPEAIMNGLIALENKIREL